MNESADTPRMTCDAFHTTLGDFLEGGLTDCERQLSQEHLAGCAECSALVADLDHIVHAAGTLPPLTPSRDLWPQIERRLEPAVLALPIRQAPELHARNVSWRSLATAAALLVTASVGITWTLARSTSGTVEVPALAFDTDTMRRSAATTDVAAISSPTRLNAANDSLSPDADGPAIDQIALRDERRLVRNSTPVNSGSSASGVATAVVTRTPNTAAVQLSAVANPERMMALDTLYGREIAKLRTVAESQLGLLDSSTVNVVRRNLDIIDKAILESRAALESDPNSGFLLEQLDRAYERKVDLLRRLALL